jgi:hypothetical protein
MKRFLLLLACSGAFACAAELATVHTVYLLPMSRGMDQFLASRLTNGHVLQVVTDPKLADVILSDHIGEGFEAQMAALFPPPAPPKPAAPAAPATPPPAATASASTSPMAMFTDPTNKAANPAMSSSFSRTRGTIFLVDAKSHEVLWSVYDPPKSTTGKSLDRTATDIVSRLKRDMNKK